MFRDGSLMVLPNPVVRWAMLGECPIYSQALRTHLVHAGMTLD